MTNIPNPIPFDRDDPEARRQSVEFQWNAMRQLYQGLPNFHALTVMDNAQQIAVAQEIADNVLRIRNLTGNTLEQIRLQTALIQKFTDKAASSIHSEAVGQIDVSRLRVGHAEAWLQSIYEIIENQDVREMLTRTPIAIGSVANRPDIWLPNIWLPMHLQVAVHRGGSQAATNVLIRRIHLSNGFWQKGDEITIRRNLTGLTFAQAGIVTATGSQSAPTIDNEVITNAHLDAIFGSRAQINDPMRSAIHSPRSHPTVTTTLTNAISRRAQVESLITGNSNSREMMMALAALQRDPGALQAIRSTNVDAAQIQTDLQTAQERLRAANVVKNLREGSISEFDLATIDAGITEAWHVIVTANGAAGQPDGIDIDLFNPLTLNATVRSLFGKNKIRPQLRRSIIAAVPPNTTAGFVGTPEVNNINVFQDQGTYAQAAIDALERAREQNNVVTQNLQRMISVLRAQGINPARITHDRYPQLYRYITDALAFSASPLPGDPLPPVGIPPVVPGDYEVQSNQIRTPEMNLNEIVREYQAALINENPTQRLPLLDSSVYEKQIDELSVKLSGALSSAPNVGLQGSNACWAIIRRGIANELRLRDDSPEVDNIINVTRTMSDRTDQTRRMIDQVVNRNHPTFRGKEDNAAADEWSKDNSRKLVDPDVLRDAMSGGATVGAFTGTAIGGFLTGAIGVGAGLTTGIIGGVAAGTYLGYKLARSLQVQNVWHQYRDRLFVADHIGLPLNAEPMQKQYSFNQIVEAYFKIRYLKDHAHHESLKIPKSREVEAFERKLYEAIVARAQEGYYNQALLSEENIRQLQEGGDASRTRQPDSLQRITDAEKIFDIEKKYFEVEGTNIEEMAHDAYHPIQERVDRSEFWLNKSLRDGQGSWYNMLALPMRGVRGLKWVKDKPLTYAGKQMKENWPGMAVGAGAVWLGAAAAPGILPGAVLGIAGQKIIRYSVNKFKSARGGA